MKVLLIIISIVAIFCTKINIAVYNIQTGINMDGRYNLTGTAETISNKLDSVDIIGLQEVDNMTRRHPGHDQTHILANFSNFPFYAFGPNRKFQGGDYGNSILTKLQVMDRKSMVFEKPDGTIPNRCTTPMPNDFCQGILALHVKKENQTFWFVTTHFGNGPNELTQFESAKQSIAFIKRLQMIDANIVFTGDLNVLPTSRTIQHLLSFETGFKDLWRECKGNGNGFTFNSRNPDRRIDYLLTNIKIKTCSIVVDASQASDHRPIWASLEF